MIKPHILSAVFLISISAFRSSVYDITIPSISGSMVSISSYQGKKILVTIFNPASPDTAFLNYLNSISKANSSLQIIAVPAAELGKAASSKALTSFANSFSANFLMTAPVLVKKNANKYQGSLLKWLTNVSENGHFDTDAEEAGQLFIIGKEGTLYGVLSGGSEKKILERSINQNID